MVFLVSACSLSGGNNNPGEWKIDGLKEAINSCMAEGKYEEAIEVLESLDLERLANDNFSSDSPVQYWAVMEDGVAVPGVSRSNIDELVAIENRSWVIPGTSDSQNPGVEQKWQQIATDIAATYNAFVEQQLGARNGVGKKRGQGS